jgi:hypothetical protein
MAIRTLAEQMPYEFASSSVKGVVNRKVWREKYRPEEKKLQNVLKSARKNFVAGSKHEGADLSAAVTAYETALNEYLTFLTRWNGLETAEAARRKELATFGKLWRAQNPAKFGGALVAGGLAGTAFVKAAGIARLAIGIPLGYGINKVLHRPAAEKISHKIFATEDAIYEGEKEARTGADFKTITGTEFLKKGKDGAYKGKELLDGKFASVSRRLLLEKWGRIALSYGVSFGIAEETHRSLAQHVIDSLHLHDALAYLGLEGWVVDGMPLGDAFRESVGIAPSEAHGWHGGGGFHGGGRGGFHGGGNSFGRGGGHMWQSSGMNGGYHGNYHGNYNNGSRFFGGGQNYGAHNGYSGGYHGNYNNGNNFYQHGYNGAHNGYNGGHRNGGTSGGGSNYPAGWDNTPVSHGSQTVTRPFTGCGPTCGQHGGGNHYHWGGHREHNWGHQERGGWNYRRYDVQNGNYIVRENQNIFQVFVGGEWHPFTPPQEFNYYDLPQAPQPEAPAPQPPAPLPAPQPTYDKWDVVIRQNCNNIAVTESGSSPTSFDFWRHLDHGKLAAHTSDIFKPENIQAEADALAKSEGWSPEVKQAFVNAMNEQADLYRHDPSHYFGDRPIQVGERFDAVEWRHGAGVPHAGEIAMLGDGEKGAEMKATDTSPTHRFSFMVAENGGAHDVDYANDPSYNGPDTSGLDTNANVMELSRQMASVAPEHDWVVTLKAIGDPTYSDLQQGNYPAGDQAMLDIIRNNPAVFNRGGMTVSQILEQSFNF